MARLARPDRHSPVIAPIGQAPAYSLVPAPPCPVEGDAVLLLIGQDAPATTLVAALAAAGLTGFAATHAEVNAALRVATAAAIVVTGDALRGIDLDAMAAAIADQPSWCDTMVIGVDIEGADLAARRAQLDHMATFIAAGPQFDEGLIISLARAAVRSHRKRRLRSQDVETAAPDAHRPKATPDDDVFGCAVEPGLPPTIASNAGKLPNDSDQRDRAVIEMSDLLLFTADAAGNLVRIDDRFFEITGLSRTARMSLTTEKDRVHPDDRERVHTAQRGASGTGAALNYEYRGRVADGSYRWWQFRAAPVVGADGTILGWNGTLLDIHDRKVAEQRLFESELRHRASIALSCLVTFTLDADGQLADIDGHICELTGFSMGELFGHAPEDICHPDDLALLARVRDDAVATRGGDLTLRLRHADGKYNWWRARAAPRIDAGDRIVGWFGTLEDVNLLVTAQERLRASEERYRFAIQTSNLVTYTASAEGRIVAMDEVAAVAVGLDVDKILEQGSDLTWHPDHLGAIQLARREASITGRYDQTSLMANGDGTYHWCRSRAAPFRDANGKILRWHGTLENVDELKRAEEKLRESEDRHRFCIELSKLVTFTATPDAVIESIDETIVTATGANPADIVGTLPVSFCHPDDVAPLAAALQAAQEAEVFDHCYRLGEPAGGYRWWRSRAKLRRDEAGNAVRVYGTLEDIHDLRSAEAQLRESEELHRLSLKLSDMAVWTATPDGFVNDIGGRLFEVTGLTREQMFGRRLRDWLHPHDADRVFEMRRRSLSERAPADFDFRMLKADGSYHWWRWRSAPQFGSDGAIIRWYGTLENVDSLRSVEEQLRASEQMHRHSIELSNLIVWTGSAEGKFLTFSPRIFKRLGLTREMTKTLAPLTLVHPEDFPAAATAVQAGLQHGMLADIKLRLRDADGQYSWWRVRASPLRADDGSVVRWYGTLEDVDSVTRGEQQLHQLQAEIAHISRLNAMGTMASTLAHELNQPLAAVLNYIAGCRRLLGDPSESSIERIEAAMRSAEDCALRAGEIIRRVRQQVSRGDTKHVLTSIGSLIQDACAIALINARELSIELVYDLDPEVASVQVDRIQVQQVIINLLRNAVEAVTGRDDRKIVVSTRLINGYCALAIDDTGPGVNEAIASRLFEPFESSKANGMGIGLSISRTIAESHGGKLEYARSKLGGARFTVLLPVAPPDR